MVESNNYGWDYAEVIAMNMKTLFDSPNVDDRDKVTALELAIHAAIAMNRFAAMDTCQAMITSIESDGLAFLAREVLRKLPERFICNIEPVNCRHDTIASTVRELIHAADDA